LDDAFDAVCVALSAPSAACNGPEKHAQIPAAMINAERPLALIVIGNLPIFLPTPETQGDPTACPQRGRKRESSRESGQKRGNSLYCASNSRPLAGEVVLESMQRMSGVANDVMSLPE
jgi:hypothetical protein